MTAPGRYLLGIVTMNRLLAEVKISRRGFLAAAAGATLVSRSLPAWASDKMKQVAFGLDKAE